MVHMSGDVSRGLWWQAMVRKGSVGDDSLTPKTWERWGLQKMEQETFGGSRGSVVGNFSSDVRCVVCQQCVCAGTGVWEISRGSVLSHIGHHQYSCVCMCRLIQLWSEHVWERGVSKWLHNSMHCNILTLSLVHGLFTGASQSLSASLVTLGTCCAQVLEHGLKSFPDTEMASASNLRIT
jgi:hypothetical protein